VPPCAELWINGQASGLRVRRAEHWFQRAVGLLASPPLDDPAGLWIKPCNAVHMWGMRYAIDVLFLDGTGRVLKRVDGLKPWRASACNGARVALELRAGLAAQLGVCEGQVLALQ
jgi:uncharacterized protein